MTDLNRYGRQRLEYLRSRQPEILKELEEYGILNTHLFYTQKRAGWQLEQLVMGGMEKSEAEEFVRREIIQS